MLYYTNTIVYVLMCSGGVVGCTLWDNYATNLLTN